MTSRNKFNAEAQIARVRRICMALPGAEEKPSHGEPTWFVNKRVFAMFSNNHHNDGHIAIHLPAAPGRQATMIEEAPEIYYRPPYVGTKGWIGVELANIGDAELTELIEQAWQIISDKSAPKVRKPKTLR